MGSHYHRKQWYYNRNYVLFGLLAGVRCSEIKPLSEPRGIPSDASDLVKQDWKDYEPDGHTPSYFYLPELFAAKDQNSVYIAEIIWERPNSSISETFWDVIEGLRELDPDPSNIRVVFWFDN